MKKSQVVIAFIIVFLSGLMIGVLGGKYYYYVFRGDPPPPPRNLRGMFTNKIAQRLKLTDEQQEKLKPAFEKWHVSFTEMNKSNAPLMKKIFFALYDDVEKALPLNQEQKEELAKMRQMTIDRVTMHGKFNIPGEPPPPFPPPPPEKNGKPDNKPPQE